MLDEVPATVLAVRMLMASMMLMIYVPKATNLGPPVLPTITIPMVASTQSKTQMTIMMV